MKTLPHLLLILSLSFASLTSFANVETEHPEVESSDTEDNESSYYTSATIVISTTFGLGYLAIKEFLNAMKPVKSVKRTRLRVSRFSQLHNANKQDFDKLHSFSTPSVLPSLFDPCEPLSLGPTLHTLEKQSSSPSVESTSSEEESEFFSSKVQRLKNEIHGFKKSSFTDFKSLIKAFRDLRNRLDVLFANERDSHYIEKYEKMKSLLNELYAQKSLAIDHEDREDIIKRNNLHFERRESPAQKPKRERTRKVEEDLSKDLFVLL